MDVIRYGTKRLAFVEGEEGETEGGVFLLIQQVGDTNVVSDDGGNDANDTTCFGRCCTGVEGTSSEDGEGCGEGEEQGDEADALSHAYNATEGMCQSWGFW